MIPKDRVLAAMRHECSDRVPLFYRDEPEVTALQGKRNGRFTLYLNAGNGARRFFLQRLEDVFRAGMFQAAKNLAEAAAHTCFFYDIYPFHIDHHKAVYGCRIPFYLYSL